MKNHSRLTALLLCLLLLLSSAACSSGEVEETENTTAPETTAAIIEETTEEVISVVAPPETTEAPETTETTPTEAIRIIMQDGKGEAILSALAEDKYKPLLDAREQALLYGHSAEIELSKAENLKSSIENLVLAGESRYDLVLTDPFIGADLLNSGFSENFCFRKFNTYTKNTTPSIILNSIRNQQRTINNTSINSYLFVSGIK